MKALCNAYGVHVARCREYFLCLTRSILFSLCMLLSFSGYAQDIKLANPSMEGNTSEGTPPEYWYSIERTPDTQPGVYNITYPASDGKSYLGLYCDQYLQEGVTQQLPQQLDSGKTYYLSFDLAYPATYFQKVAYGSLILYAGNVQGERTEVLWKSGAFYNQTWKRFTAIFTPTKSYSFIVLSPYKMEKDPAVNNTAVLVDNLSDIKEAIKLDLSSVNTCLGSSNGGATARILDADDSYTYRWEPSGDTVNSVKGLAAGTYKVSVRSRSGATTYGSIQVSTSDVHSTVSIVPISCNGDQNGIINVAATGGQPPYTFYLDDELAERSTGLITNVAAGKYTVKTEDKNGCTAVLNDIVVAEPPLLKIQSVVATSVSCSGVQNGKIIINAEGGTAPYTYSITGSVSGQDNVINHLDAGTYHYSVTDSHACYVEGDAEIKKEWRDCAVFVPNAFSPNADGLNDIFRAKVHDDVSDFRMAVYGRWGQLVFESRDPSQGWDGTQKGLYQPSGSYLWVVTYTDSKQQAIKQQGTLLLVR